MICSRRYPDAGIFPNSSLVQLCSCKIAKNSIMWFLQFVASTFRIPLCPTSKTMRSARTNDYFSKILEQSEVDCTKSTNGEIASVRYVHEENTDQLRLRTTTRILFILSFSDRIVWCIVSTAGNLQIITNNERDNTKMHWI